MTLNDFKSIEGDRQMGIGSLPARLGVTTAARVACAVMALPQAVVVALCCSAGTGRCMRSRSRCCCWCNCC
jgi:chlorophyll/bacteriochlorophyll a synthase